jgi:hypothetical protein
MGTMDLGSWFTQSSLSIYVDDHIIDDKSKCKCHALMIRDFYFRALRSLVVLSFPQLVSFSSVLSKPLSETLRRSLDGRIPV